MLFRAFIASEYTTNSSQKVGWSGQIHNLSDDLGDNGFYSKVQSHHGFFPWVFDCPENYINSFFSMHGIYLPKLFVFTLTVELLPLDFRSKTHIFSHTHKQQPGRTELGKAGKQHRGIFRVHQFLESANGWLMVWVPVVWIPPRIPLWKGLLLRGTSRIPNHQLS